MEKRFTEYLQEIERTDVGLSDGKKVFRMFAPLHFVDYSELDENLMPKLMVRVSIQASEMHYCYPRMTLEDVEKYSMFEVMITRTFKRERMESPDMMESSHIQRLFEKLYKKYGEPLL